MSSVGFGYRWDAYERWSVWLQVWLPWACGSWLQLGSLGAMSCLYVIKYRCYSLQLNLLLSLSCYKLTYHYFSYTCWVATISLLTVVVTLLRSWRWDELLWWRFPLEVCVALDRLPVGLVCSAAARWESRYSLLCKDNISCNNVYIIKTLVFCIHILAVCMTTWSWAYIWWASGFGLKTWCDNSLLTLSNFLCQYYGQIYVFISFLNFSWPNFNIIVIIML
jgi:hypothetical protein